MNDDHKLAVKHIFNINTVSCSYVYVAHAAMFANYVSIFHDLCSTNKYMLLTINTSVFTSKPLIVLFFDSTDFL